MWREWWYQEHVWECIEFCEVESEGVKEGVKERKWREILGWLWLKIALLEWRMRRFERELSLIL